MAIGTMILISIKIRISNPETCLISISMEGPINIVNDPSILGFSTNTNGKSNATGINRALVLGIER